MSNYITKTRTNYFSVTDEEKFKQIISSCKASDSIEVFDEKQENGSVKYGFYCYGSIQGFTDRNESEESDDMDCNYNYDAFCKALQQIIPDGEAIIITEIGFENMRYLTGESSIITRNYYKCITLQHEAVKIAGKMLNNPDFTTK